MAFEECLRFFLGRGGGAICLSLLLQATGRGQLDLRLSSPEPSYLQFAPIPVTIHCKNLGAGDLILQESQGKPWMDLVVQSNDGLVIRPDRTFSPPDLSLKPGESKDLPVDLVPYFLVREPGAYQVRASVRLPSGETLLTQPVSFLIGRGEVVWSVPRGEGRNQRTYSLLKYYEDPNVGLYFRVEIPGQNIVFPSRRLGPYLPLGKPMAEFDNDSHLHLLYAVASGQYRLTVLNQDGDVLREENRQQTLEKPILRRSPDGMVDVVGGSVILPAYLREKLSSLQSQAGTTSSAP